METTSVSAAPDVVPLQVPSSLPLVSHFYVLCRINGGGSIAQFVHPLVAQMVVESAVEACLDPGALEVILRPGPTRDVVINHMLQELYQQCMVLCQRKNCCSVLRGLKPSELLTFSFDRLAEEWAQQTAPLLLQFLATVANVSLSPSLAVPPGGLPSICAAGAVLLRERNVHMSALHHLVGLILFHGNARKLVSFKSNVHVYLEGQET